MLAVTQLSGQFDKPKTGLFYYADDCHTTEIEFFPGNMLCIINTVCDIAMFETTCGPYHWNGDTLIFESDPHKFLETQLFVDTLGCKAGEVLIHSKTITPLNQPGWRNFIKPKGTYSVKVGDSLKILNAIVLPDMQYKLSMSEIQFFDSLSLDKRERVKGPKIPIPTATCMNVEFPVLDLGYVDNLYEHKYFIFSNITNNKVQITVIHNTFSYSRTFDYIIRDPFGQ